MSAKSRCRAWTAVVAQGIVWGIAVSLLDAATLPATAGGAVPFLGMLAWTTPGWCIVGIGLATWLHLAQDRMLRPAFLLGSLAACAIVLSGVRSLAYLILGVPPPALFPQGAPPLPSFLYQAWSIAFYGGLYFLAWTLDRRARRTRELLAQAGVARLRTQAMLGEAQLAALRNHLEPGLLLRVMRDVERRYAQDTDAADRLLGMLVHFLRLAMPGVRGRRSTLHDEVKVCRAYAALAAELQWPGADWRFACTGRLRDVPFPPLALLAAQAAAGAQAARSFHGTMRIVIMPHRVGIELDTDPPPAPGWLDPSTVYRLRAALAAQHRDGWQLAVPGTPVAGAPCLSIHLVLEERSDRDEARSIVA